MAPAPVGARPEIRFSHTLICKALKLMQFITQIKLFAEPDYAYGAGIRSVVNFHDDYSAGRNWIENLSFKISSM